MAYFLAPSLASLRSELNAAHPDRDRSSDGWIGDAAHAARKSDHNPDYAAGGIVRALDVDKDGIDTDRLLQVAISSPSTEYVIWNRKIYLRSNKFRASAYLGSNAHTGHMHISIRHTAAAASARLWGYTKAIPEPTPPPAPAPAPEPAPEPAPVRKTNEELAREVLRGLWGNNPQRGQRLAAEGYSPTEVQAEVIRLIDAAAAPPVRLSVEALAQQVIAGQWGNGTERQSRLTAAGYDYAAVQAEVNRRL